MGKEIKKAPEQTRIVETIDFIAAYGNISGCNHKQWVIDQILRTLIGNEKEYEDFIGESWDAGIAP